MCPLSAAVAVTVLGASVVVVSGRVLAVVGLEVVVVDPTVVPTAAVVEVEVEAWVVEVVEVVVVDEAECGLAEEQAANAKAISTRPSPDRGRGPAPKKALTGTWPGPPPGSAAWPASAPPWG